MNGLPAPASASRGFTLIELLVVVSIIALLIGILVPSLAVARAKAQQTSCAAELRGLAQAALVRANEFDGQFSTGEWENRRAYSQGPIDESGWVADFIKGEFARPGDMLCPSSPAKVSQSLAADRLNGPDVWRTFTPEEVDRLYDAGFNTNYTQSWYMAHSGMKDHFRIGGDPKDKRNTVGPLTQRVLDSAPTTPALVPLFADATAQARDDFATIKGQRFVAAKTLSDGPAGLATGPLGRVWGRQDYTDFGPAHGKGSLVFGQIGHDRESGNFAFADGHVASFRDSSGGPTRDGVFGHNQAGTTNGWSRVQEYHELEGKIYGGWLTQPGLNW